MLCARKVVLACAGFAGALVQMGQHQIDRARWDWNEVGNNPVLLSRCPARKRNCSEDYPRWHAEARSGHRRVMKVVAEGVPAGLGAPIYGKVDSDLAAALMSINAVKGVEIGAGFGAAELSGEDDADEMRLGNGWEASVFSPTAPAGFSAGISTGQPVVARFRGQSRPRRS